MKKIITLFSFAFLILASPVLAQEDFQAKTGSSQDVLVGDSVSFDAGSSTIPDNTEPAYTWWFGDGVSAKGERVTHIYKRAGSYEVKLNIQVNDRTSEASTQVRVYRYENILVTDETIADDRIKPLIEQAEENDILLTVVTPPTTAVTVSEGMARSTLDKRLSLERAPLVFVWANGTKGTDALTNLGQLISGENPDEKRKFHMEEKGMVLITDQSFSIVARPAQTAFNVLRPAYVLLVKSDALPALVKTKSANEATEVIREQKAQFWNLGPHSERAVSKLAPWNALSYVVNALVNWGVPTSSIVLILMLPIVATLLAFSRQVIGMKAFGIFTPAAVTLSFLAIGLKYGVLIFIVILLAATGSRILIRKFRLLYLPRMALVLTAVSFAVLALFGVSGLLLKQTGALAFSVFPILILASLAEQFVEAQIRLGLRAAAILTFETLLLSVVSTLIIQWDALQSLIVGFPELILITIPINILLGRWTGLRLSEYIRFRKLLFPVR